MNISPLIKNKLECIKLLLLDVDGVLTNGSIIYNDNGSETKIFNVKDGLGIRMLQDSNIKVGIVTARTSKALKHRCKDLNISLLFDGVKNKKKKLEHIQEITKTSIDEIAFIGDDLQDLPLLQSVGLSIAVHDANDVVLENVDLITDNKGGQGSVREVCEAILKAKGLWNISLKKYLETKNK